MARITQSSYLVFKFNEKTKYIVSVIGHVALRRQFLLLRREISPFNRIEKLPRNYTYLGRPTICRNPAKCPNDVAVGIHYTVYTIHIDYKTTPNDPLRSLEMSEYLYNNIVDWRANTKAPKFVRNANK